MQASRFTAIAGWLVSRGGAGSEAGKRLAVRPAESTWLQKAASGSGARSRGGWSASSSSSTIARAATARSLAVLTTIPGSGTRRQDAARTRSPLTSTMQARQLPSAR